MNCWIYPSSFSSSVSLRLVQTPLLLQFLAAPLHRHLCQPTTHEPGTKGGDCGDLDPKIEKNNKKAVFFSYLFGKQSEFCEKNGEI
jgi:hypothetical protein